MIYFNSFSTSEKHQEKTVWHFGYISCFFYFLYIYIFSFLIHVSTIPFTLENCLTTKWLNQYLVPMTFSLTWDKFAPLTFQNWPATLPGRPDPLFQWGARIHDGGWMAILNWSGDGIFALHILTSPLLLGHST